MLKLKMALGLLTLSMTSSALAYITCAGETYAGTAVQVHVQTLGSMAVPEMVSVGIQESTGASRAYNLKKDEISQFFENADGDRAIVGLAAYASLNNPLWIKYVGYNFEGDLVEVLRNPARVKQSENEMRIWKGPGYGPSEQYQFTDVVCSVTIDL